MKFSEHWLREWVSTPLSSADLQERLTVSGLEVDSVAPVAGEFTNVVVGLVLSKEKHPDADKLSVCQVDLAEGEPVQIVCGAKNVAAGMKVPVAKIGAVLGGDFKIKKSKLRGVASHGMICSESELGLAETSSGIMPLPEDAPIGIDISAYLKLDDVSIDIDLTPNRGDCLSVQGVARETAALTGAKFNALEVPAVKATHKETFPVEVLASKACPRYVGRVIKNIQNTVESPLWLKEKLRRSGIRFIDPVVDVTNYVLLGLGQPMHAFDLDKLDAKITVRMASKGESITLLDDSTKTLESDTLVIADQQGPLAIAGVMGGQASGVSSTTKHIFLESAYFTPEIIAGKARQYQAHTDSSHRFERGVDFEAQVRAMERATALLLEIVGGEPGPIIEVCAKDHLPKREAITLRYERLTALLGYTIPEADVTRLLNHSGLSFNQTKTGWTVLPPSYRFDLNIEEDLIEEIARMAGYDTIPCHMPSATISTDHHAAKQRLLPQVKSLLSDVGYHEVITYSFVDQKKQALLHPEIDAIGLSNPISSDMAVMRCSLWTGLLQVLHYNLARQVTRLNIFEAGMCFVPDAKDIVQKNYVAGLVCGANAPEQWGVASRKSDFYDVKADVTRLCQAIGIEVTFKASETSGLHPGQTAAIYQNDKLIGHVGAVHPEVMQALKMPNCFLFSICLDDILQPKPTRFKPFSKFPSVERDIAIVIDQKHQSSEVLGAIKQAAGGLLSGLTIFDIYQGEGIPEGHQSLAIRLTLNSFEGTLEEQDVTNIMEVVTATLAEKFDAHLR